MIIAIFLCISFGQVASLTTLEEAEQNASLLYEGIFRVFDEAVRFTDYQAYITETTDTQRTLVDGEQLLEQYSSNITRRIKYAEQAVSNLTSYLQNNTVLYETSQSLFPYKMCSDNQFPDSYFSPITTKRSDFDDLCYNFPPGVQGKVFPPTGLLDQMKKVYEYNPTLPIQYFSTEEGGVFFYPATDYDYFAMAYDPRMRPFYGATVNAYRRDVVLVLDNSEKTKQEFGDTTYYNAIVQAAVHAVQALTVKDRFSVTTVTPVTNCELSISSPDCCIFDQFQPASERLQSRIPDLLSQALRPHDKGSYAQAIKLAFDYQNHFGLDNRIKVILLITATRINDMKNTRQVLYDARKKYGTRKFPPYFFMYKVGISNSLTKDLQDLRDQYIFERSRVISLKSSSDLVKASLYYKYLQPYFSGIRLISPYTSFSKRILVVTTVKPVFNSTSGRLVGVMAIDFHLSDLLEGLFPNSLGQGGYGFVFDLEDNNTIYHPLIPHPNEINIPSSDVNINLLEKYHNPSREITEVLNSILASEKGSALVTFPSNERVSNQSKHNSTDKVSANITKEYVYGPVYSVSLNWSLCIILDPEEATFQMRRKSSSLPGHAIFSTYTQDETYDEFPDSCRTYYVRSNKTLRTLLSYECFLRPAEFLYREETKDIATHYEAIVRGEVANDVFVDGVVDDLMVSNHLYFLWTTPGSDQDSVPYAVRRYVATKHGILRVYPAPLLPPDKLYNFVSMELYQKAERSPSSLVVSPAFVGELGEGHLVTIAKAFTDQTHDDSLGVLAMDLPVRYFQTVIENSLPFCQANNQSCFLMDSSGYVLSNPGWLHATWRRFIKIPNALITVVEEEVANLMLLKKHLKKKMCFNLYEKRLNFYYETDFVTIDDGDGYTVARVPNTDFFLVIKYDIWKVKLRAFTCDCVYQACTSTGIACGCTCVKAPVDTSCDLYTLFDNNHLVLCTASGQAMRGPYDIKASSASFDGVGSDFCDNIKCSNLTSITECNRWAGCRWCAYSTGGKPINAPFCGRFDACWYGQVGKPTLYESLLGYLASPAPGQGDVALAVILVSVGLAIGIFSGIISWLNHKDIKEAQDDTISMTSQTLPKILITPEYKESTEHHEEGSSVPKLTRLPEAPAFSKVKSTPASSPNLQVCYVNREGQEVEVECSETKPNKPPSVDSLITVSSSSLSSLDLSISGDSSTAFDDFSKLHNTSKSKASSPNKKAAALSKLPKGSHNAKVTCSDPVLNKKEPADRKLSEGKSGSCLARSASSPVVSGKSDADDESTFDSTKSVKLVGDSEETINIMTLTVSSEVQL